MEWSEDIIARVSGLSGAVREAFEIARHIAYLELPDGPEIDQELVQSHKRLRFLFEQLDRAPEAPEVSKDSLVAPGPRVRYHSGQR
jgi:hypothetical protein